MKTCVEQAALRLLVVVAIESLEDLTHVGLAWGLDLATDIPQ